MASKEARGDNSGFVDNWQSGKSLVECNLHMLTSEDSHDVSFRVGKEEKLVRAHRYVLMSRSCVFHAMLGGPLAEKEEIKIPDVEGEIFSEMLRYLYTDKLTLTAENVTGVLYLAKKYAVGGLERLCLTYLESSLTAENACVILEQAHVFDEEELFDMALKVIVQNGDFAFKSHGFKDLCKTCFKSVVISEDVLAKPETVFKAAILWAEQMCNLQGRQLTPENKRLVLGDSVYDIDFTKMDPKEFAKSVVPSGILSSDETTKLFCFLTVSEGDVAPFKIKPKQQRLLEISLYGNDVLSKAHDQCSVIIITCDSDIRLVGFAAYGSGDCVYDMQLDDDEAGYFHSLKSVRVAGKSAPGGHVTLQLKEPCLLSRDVQYRVNITMVSGETVMQGCTLLSHVVAGNCHISVKRSGINKNKYGLISKLILKEI